MQGKYFLIIFVSVLITSMLQAKKSRAAYVIYPDQLKTEINAPKNDYLRAAIFMNLSPAEFSAITGKKLHFVERLMFKTILKRIKKDYKKNPDLLITEYYDPVKEKFKLDMLWFVLGVIIGPLAILFALTTKGKKMSRKSAFLGFLVFIIWFGFLFLF